VAHPTAARGGVTAARLAARLAALALLALAGAAGMARAWGAPPAAPLAPAAPRPSSFAVAYARPATADYDLYYEELRRQRFLESVAQELDRILDLPAPLTLRLEECGHSTTLLSRDGRSVIVCYEYLDAVLVIAAAGARSEERAEQLFSGAVTFALLSEIGQALIGLLELPVPAGAQRGGDQFAAIALAAADKDGDPSAAAAVEFLGLALRDPDLGFEYLETHAFDRARLADVACLLYGNAPGNHAAARTSGALPPSRAARCPEELVATVKAWDGYLAKYTRPGAATGRVPAAALPAGAARH
jgi:hypothetical protein